MSDPTAQNLPDDDGSDEGLEEKQRLLDRFRGTGVGVEDPNIVGDAGATDVPPGEDPDSGGGGEPTPGRDPDTAPPGA